MAAAATTRSEQLPANWVSIARTFSAAHGARGAAQAAMLRSSGPAPVAGTTTTSRSTSTATEPVISRTQSDCALSRTPPDRYSNRRRLVRRHHCRLNDHDDDWCNRQHARLWTGRRKRLSRFESWVVSQCPGSVRNLHIGRPVRRLMEYQHLWRNAQLGGVCRDSLPALAAMLGGTGPMPL